jgi:Mrr N-terminal domain
MPVVRLSASTMDRLKSHAEPFVDKPEDVVNRALDALDEKLGRIPKPQTAPVPEKTAGGKKLPQKEFRLPLLKTLLDLGSSANVSEIRKLMETKVGSLLSEADYQLVSSGDPRWWNAVCWERSNLAKEGLIDRNTERGVWALTEEGKRVAKG